MDVKNNTPSAGYIKWTGVSIAYKGQTYKIADGNTNFVYIYWKYSDPLSFYGSNVFPTLGDDDLLVFLNKQGTHVKVPTATVVDGSLIVPESILTDALAANSVSAEKIQTDAITARQVKAGSLTSDLLATGVNPNIVRDGYDTLSQLPTGTGYVTKGTATTFQILDYANGLTGGRVLQAIGGNGYLAKSLTDFTIPVTAGQKLIVSAYVRSDLAGSNNQAIGLRFNNTALDVLGATIAVSGNTGWQRLATIVTVPAGATKAMLYISSLGTYYWDAFMVEVADATQTQASTWKPAGTTVIWGGNIAARSIDVDRLNATDLSAISANLGKMTAGSMEGVSLLLGQVGNQGILRVVADRGGGVLEDVGRIDVDGGYFPALSANKIRGDVENVWTGGFINYYFDSVAGNDANDGLSWATAKKNMQNFINSLPKNLNGFWLQLNLKNDIYGGIAVTGFHNGDILIVGNTSARPKIFGKTTINKCSRGRFLFQSFDAQGDVSTSGQSVINCYYSDFVNMQDVKVYGNNKASHAFWMENCPNFSIDTCQAYGVSDRGLYALRSKGYLANCSGSVPIAVLADNGSVVQGIGSRWSGSIVRWGLSIIGAYKNDGSKWVNDIWSEFPEGGGINNGEAAPPPPPPASEQTVTFTSAGGDSWSSVGGYNNDRVSQGDWGYGQQTGLWYFDLTSLRSKTIVSASLTITRNAGGSSAVRTAYIRTHKYPSRSSRPNGTPPISANYQTTSIAVGETKSFDITSLIQTNIASGSIDVSLGAYITGATDYMNMAPNATLVVRYK